MTKQLLKNLVVGLLVLVAIGMVGTRLMPLFSGGPSGSYEATAQEPEPREEESGPPAPVPGAVEPLTALPISDRNPFTITSGRSPQPEPEAMNLDLAATWHQAGASAAILNNRILRAGDRVGEAVLSSIETEGCWVLLEGTRTFVPVRSTIPQPAEQADPSP